MGYQYFNNFGEERKSHRNLTNSQGKASSGKISYLRDYSSKEAFKIYAVAEIEECACTCGKAAPKFD